MFVGVMLRTFVIGDEGLGGGVFIPSVVMDDYLVGRVRTYWSP